MNAEAAPPTSVARGIRTARGTIVGVPVFPSMREAALLRILERELGYVVVATRGSHKKLRSDRGYPQLTFAFHTGHEISSGLVRKILVKDVGLSVEAAAQLLGLG